MKIGTKVINRFLSGLLRSICVCVLFTAVISCGDGNNGGKTEEVTPKFYRQSPASHGVIVFVHGVMGSAEDTWRNSASNTYWPEMLASDATFDGMDIYTHEYPSPLFATSFNINEVAEQMRLYFEGHEFEKYKEIVFVVHSMGGLVTRQFLVKYQEYAEKVSLISFFATPSQGSQVASLANFLSKNKQYGNMAPMESDNFLGI